MCSYIYSEIKRLMIKQYLIKLPSCLKSSAACDFIMYIITDNCVDIL